MGVPGCSSENFHLDYCPQFLSFFLRFRISPPYKRMTIYSILYIIYALYIFYSGPRCSNILQISPTRCTILLNIFISLLYRFRASMCPSSGENYCIYATLVFFTLYGWRLVCSLDFNPTSRPDATHTGWQPPVSHRYSNFLLIMGTWMPETCREVK
jgi:Mn2+/Fe2+ NRAMP family transporter